MARRPARAVVAAMAVTLFLVVTGCASGGDAGTPAQEASVAVTTDPTAPVSPAPSPTTAELATTTVPPVDGTIETYLGADGAMTVEGALALFAATYAPLPGVVPATATVADADGLILSTLSAARDELTEAQLTVVDAVIGGPGIPLDAVTGVVGEARLLTGERSRLAVPIIYDAIDHFSARLGRTIPPLVTLVELPTVGDDGTVYFRGDDPAAAAAVQLLDPDTLVYDECLIRFNTDVAYDATVFRSQVAHEVYHCFQFSLGFRRPAWIHEGQAAYAGEEFAGGTALSLSWWQGWIDRPTMRLDRRWYDAIGLFSLTAALGVDPYSYFDELMRTKDVATVHAAAPGLADAWGAHYAGEPEWGARFAVAGPGAPRMRPPRFPISLAVDGAVGRYIERPADARQAAQVYELDAPGDVLSIDPQGASGVLRFADGVELVLTASAAGDFCLAPGGCVCPGATTTSAVSVTTTHAFLGLGPAPGLYPAIRARSLEEWCAERPAPTTTTPAGACEIGTWRSTGLVLPPVPGIETQYAGGDGVIVTFGADGSFHADYDAMTAATARAQVPGGPVAIVSVRFSGVLAGSWSLGDDERLNVVGDAGAVHVTSTLTAGGGPTSRILDTTLAELGAASGAPVFTTTSCVEGRLEVSSAFAEGSVAMTLERI